MKTLFASLFSMLLLTQFAAAQFKPGMKAIGGSIRAGGSNGHEGTAVSPISADAARWNVSFGPSAAYYYSENAAVGATLLYSYDNADLDSSNSHTSETHAFSYGLNPFWRYNKIMSERFGFYDLVSPSLLYTHSDGSVAPRIQAWQFGLLGQFGGYYFVSKRLAMEVGFATLSYNYRIDHTNHVQTGRHHLYNLTLQPLQNVTMYWYF